MSPESWLSPPPARPGQVPTARAVAPAARSRLFLVLLFAAPPFCCLSDIDCRSGHNPHISGRSQATNAGSLRYVRAGVIPPRRAGSPQRNLKMLRKLARGIAAEPAGNGIANAVRNLARRGLRPSKVSDQLRRFWYSGSPEQNPPR